MDSFSFRRWWIGLDKIIFIAIFILLLSGLVLIASVSPYISKRIGLTSYHFFYNQLFNVCISVFLMLFISCLNFKGVKIFTFMILIISITTMVLVLLFFPSVKGAKRWLYLFGLSIQPSEFMKPCFFILIGMLIVKEKYKAVILLYLSILSLLFFQPDFGNIILLTVSFLSQIFVSGISILFCLIISFIGVISFILALIFIPHVKIRIDKFFSGVSSAGNFQVSKSLEAIENGGFLGLGPGEGIVKYHLPDAHTDFIFAVASEEFGILFCLFLLGIFFIVISRVFIHLWKMKDRAKIIMLVGLIMQFFLQVFINIGVSLHIMPTKGMTLPFISYGGSSIMAFGISSGIILTLTRKSLSED
ncbi:FtsW/RodA/SpoVE family cell cycle protein [Anaplasmataceae bacterium AB001_6]|nr:FtsW/RodA/SpoVE family cell cycle protein [Anaplasmataceae bacterium AB001_6]